MSVKSPGVPSSSRGRPAAADGADPLVLTGERTLPGIPDERYWFARHVVAYRLAGRVAGGLRVLDAGCGEGYGAAMLADAGAAEVVAVDLDRDVVAHVERTYPEVTAVAAELGDLPFEDGRFDLVVSLQVVEHVWDVPAYLHSLRRVLRRDGALVVSTPNRLTFTPDSDDPTNPFHVREFAPDELRDELQAAGFRVGSVLGVHHGRRLRAVERTLRQPLPRVLGEPPDRWPAWVRRLVHAVDDGWFEVHGGTLDESLDLIALCRAPAAP